MELGGKLETYSSMAMHKLIFICGGVGYETFVCGRGKWRKKKEGERLERVRDCCW